jgi:hypothetical protein
MKCRLKHNTSCAEKKYFGGSVITEQFDTICTPVRSRINNHNPAICSANLFSYTNISAPSLNNKYSILFTAYNLKHTKTGDQRPAHLSGYNSKNYLVADNSDGKNRAGKCAEIFIKQ